MSPASFMPLAVHRMSPIACSAPIGGWKLWGLTFRAESRRHPLRRYIGRSPPGGYSAGLDRLRRSRSSSSASSTPAGAARAQEHALRTPLAVEQQALRVADGAEIARLAGKGEQGIVPQASQYAQKAVVRIAAITRWKNNGQKTIKMTQEVQALDWQGGHKLGHLAITTVTTVAAPSVKPLRIPGVARCDLSARAILLLQFRVCFPVECRAGVGMHES
jgi:hypothetical protein